MLRHNLDLTAEEVNGVRKFFDSMKSGLYVKCSECGKWKADPGTIAFTDKAVGATVICVDCKANHEASLEQDKQQHDALVQQVADSVTAAQRFGRITNQSIVYASTRFDQSTQLFRDAAAAQSVQRRHING